MRIDWTEPALLDLEGIRNYIKKDSAYYAKWFIAKIIEAAEHLANFPLVGRLVPEAEQENIRELLFHHYRIIYRVEEERILILAVIHGSRDLSRKKTKPWDII